MTALIVSEARVPVAEDQIVSSDMLTNMGIFAQGSLDDAILNFLNGGVGYTGLACSIATDPKSNVASLVSIQPGYFMRGGVVYPARDAQTVDLSNVILTVPDSTKSAIVLILADGNEIAIEGQIEELDQAQKPADPNAYWPTKIIQGDTAVVRQMNPAKRWGDAALQPQPPSYPSSYCLIATAVVDNGSIVSIRQETSTQITRLDQLAPVVAALQAQAGSDKATIAGLLATVAALRKQFSDFVASVTAELAALAAGQTNLGNQQAGQGQAGTLLVVTDYYTDGTGLTVQPNNPTYSVGAGLGFPNNGQSGALALVNQNAGNIAMMNGKLLPAFTEVVASLVYGTSPGGIAMNTLSAISSPTAKRGFGLERTRYGAAFQAAPTSNLLSNGDPTQLFALHPGDLAYDQTWDKWTANSPELSHQNGYVHDLTSRGYWTPRQAGSPIVGTPGFVVLFYPGTDQMVTTFELSLAKGTQGDIRLLICDVLAANGGADFGRVLADVTCPYASIDASADIDGVYGVAKFTMPYPILEKGGKGYAYVILSSGDHVIKTLSGVNIATGQALLILAYTYVGGQNPALAIATYNYFGTNPVAVGHRKKVASFAAGTTDVPLNPIFAATAGGIDTIDVLTPAIVPAGCDIGVKLQTGTNGAAPLGPITAAAPNLLAAHPASALLTLSLTSTGATAPIIDLNPSISGTAGSASGKQGAALTAESRVFQAVDGNGNPVNFTKTQRQVTLLGFNPAVHTYTEKAETGATYGTQTAPTTTQGPTLQPDGTYAVTFTWTANPAIQAEKLAFLGTTSDTGQTFRLSKAVTTLAS